MANVDRVQMEVVTQVIGAMSSVQGENFKAPTEVL